MTSAALSAFSLACPGCKQPYSFPLGAHCRCAVSLKSQNGIQEIISASTEQEHTEKAYRFYALFYAPISLLAYLLVWRGNLKQHIRFFRDILKTSQNIVDIATGDGSLTKLAMFVGKARPAKLLCIDISEAMLGRAKRKLPRGVTALVRGDVENLPIASESCAAVTCFGGVNSFPSMVVALQEIHRIMTPDGVMRGSALLLPATAWRRRLIQHWIHEGYQTTTITNDTFSQAVQAAGFECRVSTQYGDVLLFELVKRNKVGGRP